LALGLIHRTTGLLGQAEGLFHLLASQVVLTTIEQISGGTQR
jgi:hypothetical protein